MDTPRQNLFRNALHKGYNVQMAIQFGYSGVAGDSNAIGDIARKNGINTLYYADLETLSVLTIWRQYTVHVYGQ